MERNITSVGHRGFRFGVEENTFMAFDKAVELGVDYIEFDVQLSSDGVPVVFHDKDLERMTGVKGKIKDMSIKELKALRTINFKQEIPTLQEVFERYGNLVGFMIELKDPEATDATVQAIKTMSNKKGVCISGRDIRSLNRAYNSLVYSCICFNITKSKDYTLEDFYKAEVREDIPVPCEIISLSAQLMNERFIKKCKQLGILASIWNLGPEKEGKQFIKEWGSKGIDMILFDDPLHYKHFIEERSNVVLN